jgi:hypothetical protein
MTENHNVSANRSVIITQAQANGEIGAHENIVLRKQAEILLPENQMAIPLVDGKEERPVVQIIRQRGERERAAKFDRSLDPRRVMSGMLMPPLTKCLPWFQEMISLS